jgi:capsular polysaccharide biosynthesis protein
MSENLRHDALLEPEDENYLVSLRGFAHVLRKRLWIILAVTLAVVAVAVGYSRQEVPQYQASAKVLVGQDNEIVREPVDTSALQTLTSTVAEAANSRAIAEAVIQELDLQMSPGSLLGSLSVEVIEGTQFIQLSYADSDPERARRVANAVGHVLSERVSGDGSNANNITVTMWERVETPQAPMSPDPMRTGFLALIVGGMLGVALALLLEYLKDGWSSREQVEMVLGVPTLGAIPIFQTSRTTRTIRRGASEYERLERDDIGD